MPSVRCSESQAARRLRLSPRSIPATGSTLHVGGVCIKRIGKEQTKQHADETRRIVVVWLNEDLLRKRPLERLCELVDEIGRPAAIIGPQTSAVLLDLRMEKDKPGCALANEGVPFYAYGATVSKGEIQENPTGAANGGGQGGKIFRTIATDESLARSLKEELERRGVQPCAKDQLIATISEWDTFYGRSLRESVKDAFYQECPERKKNPDRKYLRGLDGGLAEATKAANVKELCQRFSLIGNDWRPREIVKNYLRSKRKLPPWFDVTYFYRIAPEKKKGEFEIDEKEWETVVLNSWGAHRIARVLIFWGPTSFGFLGLLFPLFAQPLNPSRGNLMRRFYDGITLLDVFAMWFLVFLVVDATLFLCLFVWRLSHSQTIWPGQVRLEFKHKLNLRDGLNVGENKVLDDWIDLQFIAERTKCINSLVWYPFAIVSLMIVSRSALFANFPLSPPIAIAQGVGLFLIFACAFALNWFAEDQRKSAQRNLRDEITRARNQAGGDAREKRWEGLLDRVNDLHEGSFRNFLQQPVVAGMLLPLGSISWNQLLERGQLFGL